MSQSGVVFVQRPDPERWTDREWMAKEHGGKRVFSTRFFFFRKMKSTVGGVEGRGEVSKFFNTDKLEALRIFCFFFVEAVVKSFSSSLMSAKMLRPRSSNKKKLIHIWGDDKNVLFMRVNMLWASNELVMSLQNGWELGFFNENLQYLTILQTPLWLGRMQLSKRYNFSSVRSSRRWPFYMISWQGGFSIVS